MQTRFGRVRLGFIVALFLAAWSVPLIAQITTQTVPISASSATTTQILAGAGKLQANVLSLGLGLITFQWRQGTRARLLTACKATPS